MTLVGVPTARGFSLIELLITVGLVGVMSAIAAPSFTASNGRSRLYTATETIQLQLRSARLAAISRNRPVRVAFNCPVAGASRLLTVTGNAAVDDAANRCTTNQPNDGAAIYLPTKVTFGNVPRLEFSGRGIVTAQGATVPMSFTVSYGNDTRTVFVTAIGRITATSP
jgi:type IV fimbrial biogenesis protein FimT